MKLLFDENLSSKLSNRLNDLFPNSLHVRDVGMKATIDPIVWDYAIAISWWIFPAAGGVIAVSLGAAFWLGRRSKPEILSTHSSYFSNNGKLLVPSNYDLSATEPANDDKSK